ncbi:hypothetical protein BDV06DRAFT_48465 [Aspergillus oleicola]
MFARGRPYLKRCGGLSTTASDHAVSRGICPDEPLLFLYPRWFAAAVRQQQRSISTTLPRNKPSGGTSGGLLPRTTIPRPRTRKHSFGASARKRWASDRCLARVLVSNTDGSGPPQSSFEARLPVTNALEDTVDSASARKRWDSHRSTALVPISNTDENGPPQPSSEDRLLISHKLKDTVDRDHASDAGFEDIFDAYGDTDEKGYVDVDAWEFEREWEQYRTPKDPMTGRRIHDRSRQQFAPPGSRPDSYAWKEYKKFLEEIPPRQYRAIMRRQTIVQNTAPEKLLTVYEDLKFFIERLEKHERAAKSRSPGFWTTGETAEEKVLFIPDETLAVFSGITRHYSASENIWFANVSHGCRVHVMPAIESVGVNRKVVILGPPEATKEVVDRILAIERLQEQGDPLVETQKPLVPVFPSRLANEHSGEHTPLVRGVWSGNSANRPPGYFDSIYEKWQTVSSVKEFAEQVEALTTSLPQHGEFMQGHQREVASALRKMFALETKRHFMSTKALNIAVSFLLEHGYTNITRSVVNHARFVTTTETMNILLKTASKSQNIWDFKNTLRAMNYFRLPPDVDTWLAYVNCLVSPMVKLDLLKELETKGYLRNQYEMKRVLQVMVQELFIKHLKNGRSVDEFFSGVQAITGSDISPSLTIQMFNATTQIKNRAAMTRLLEIYRENNLPLNAEVAKEIIQLFPNDPFIAIHYTIKCLDTPKADLDKEAYGRLFEIAYNNKYYNTCRVLWRYACMNQQIKRSMRNTVTYLLLTNWAQEKGSERERLWLTCAGKVIAGVCLQLPDYPFKTELTEVIPKEFRDDPVASLVKRHKLEGEEREMSRLIAKAIIKHDVHVASWYRPVFPLGYMLQAAVSLDIDWGDAPRPARWLLQNAIGIPIQLVGDKMTSGNPFERPDSKFLSLTKPQKKRGTQASFRREESPIDHMS